MGLPSRAGVAAFGPKLRLVWQMQGSAGASSSAVRSTTGGAAAGTGAAVFAFLLKKLLIFGCCCWRFIFRTFLSTRTYFFEHPYDAPVALSVL